MLKLFKAPDLAILKKSIDVLQSQAVEARSRLEHAKHITTEWERRRRSKLAKRDILRLEQAIVVLSFEISMLESSQDL